MDTVLYPSPIGPILTYPNTPEPYIAAVLFETFLYGLYLVLMCICVVILSRKQDKSLVLLLTAITMFLLATADIGFTFDLVFRRLLKRGITYNDLRPKYIMYAISSTIADVLLLYRCYLFYGPKRRFLIGPALLLTAATGCSFAFEGTTLSLSRFSWINLSLTVILNVVVTTLTAGRIWWMSEIARALLGKDVSKRYQAIVVIVIESGVLYTVYASLDLIFWDNATANIILDAGLIQIVGIMPTLITVQAGLGYDPQDVSTWLPAVHHKAQQTSSETLTGDNTQRRQSNVSNDIHLITYSPRVTVDNPC